MRLKVKNRAAGIIWRGVSLSLSEKKSRYPLRSSMIFLFEFIFVFKTQGSRIARFI